MAFYLKNENTGNIGCFENSQGEDWVEASQNEIDRFLLEEKRREVLIDYIYSESSSEIVQQINDAKSIQEIENILNK